MRALLTDRTLIASSVAAAVLIVVAMGLGRRSAWPATAASVIPIGIGLTLADSNWTRYTENPFGRFPQWMVVLFASSAFLFLVAAGSAPAGRTETGRRLALALAGLAAGMFLFVPETDVLRAAPGPLILVGGAVLLGWITPGPAPVAVALAAGLAWVAIVDGTARSTTLLGTATGFALAALLVVARNRLMTPVLCGWIVIGSALVGRTESVPISAALAAMVVVIGAAAAAWPAGKSQAEAESRDSLETR